MTPILYEKIKIQTVELSHDLDPREEEGWHKYRDEEVVHFERTPTIFDLLDMMVGLPLLDQLFMIANTLTVAGYTQAEIAAAFGIHHKTYRNRLLKIRKDLLKDAPLS